MMHRIPIRMCLLSLLVTSNFVFAQVEVVVETNRPFHLLTEYFRRSADVLKSEFEANVVSALSSRLTGNEAPRYSLSPAFQRGAQKTSLFLKTGNTTSSPFRLVYREDVKIARVGSDKDRSRGTITETGPFGTSFKGGTETTSEINFHVRGRIVFSLYKFSGAGYQIIKTWEGLAEDQTTFKMSAAREVKKPSGQVGVAFQTGVNEGRLLWPLPLDGIFWKGLVEIKPETGKWDAAKKSATHTLQVKNLSPWPLTGIQTELQWNQRQRNTYASNAYGSSTVLSETIRIAPNTSLALPAECKSREDVEVVGITKLEVRTAICLFDIGMP